MFEYILVVLIIGVVLTIFSGKINSELSWISRAIMDTNEYELIKGQLGFYNFIQRAIAEGIIQKGMTKDEIADAIDKYIKENSFQKNDYEWLELRKSLWFGKKENDYKITILGYGEGIPTPKLILTIKNSKLVGWKGLGAEAEARARAIQKKKV